MKKGLKQNSGQAHGVPFGGRSRSIKNADPHWNPHESALSILRLFTVNKLIALHKFILKKSIEKRPLACRLHVYAGNGQKVLRFSVLFYCFCVSCAFPLHFFMAIKCIIRAKITSISDSTWETAICVPGRYS